MRLLICCVILLMAGMPAHCEAVERLWEQLPVQQLEDYAADAGVSFVDIARMALSGDVGAVEEWPQRCIQAIKDTASRCWVQMVAIIGCTMIGELAHAFAGSRKRTRKALDLLCRMAVALTLLALFIQLSEDTHAVCRRVRSFTDAASPVLSAALALTGASGMAAAIPVSAVVADQAAVYLSTDFGLQMLRIAAPLAAAAGLGGRFSLDRLFGLSVSAVKWLLGCCMTGFLALMSAQNAVIGSRDGIAVQTAQFAVDNLLPIIGGELADTVGSVFASAILVKNAAGIAVCCMLIAMVLLPLVRLATVVLMLKVTSAAADMLSAQSVPGMIDRFCQVMEALMAILAAVAALGIILAGAVVFAAGAGR